MSISTVGDAASQQAVPPAQSPQAAAPAPSGPLVSRSAGTVSVNTDSMTATVKAVLGGRRSDR